MMSVKVCVCSVCECVWVLCERVFGVYVSECVCSVYIQYSPVSVQRVSAKNKNTTKQLGGWSLNNFPGLSFTPQK